MEYNNFYKECFTELIMGKDDVDAEVWGRISERCGGEHDDDHVAVDAVDIYNTFPGLSPEECASKALRANSVGAKVSLISTPVNCWGPDEAPFDDPRGGVVITQYEDGRTEPRCDKRASGAGCGGYVRDGVSRCRHYTMNVGDESPQ